MAKRKRRGNGEGSIYQRKDGLWAGSVIIGYSPTTGRPKRKYFYSKTRKEVADKVNKAINELQQGNIIEPNKKTVGEWLDEWMELYQTKISPNFYARRKDLIEKHIKPILGNILITKLKPSDVQRFYNMLEKEGRLDKKVGLSNGTIKHIHNILNPAMKKAVKEGLVVRNIVADTEPPPVVRTKEPRPLNKKEAKKYLNELKENHFYAAFLLELATGLRRGELLGLQWSDFDIKTGILTINRQLVRLI